MWQIEKDIRNCALKIERYTHNGHDIRAEIDYDKNSAEMNHSQWHAGHMMVFQRVDGEEETNEDYY